MCGIIFAHNKGGTAVNQAVVDQLEDQLHRGQEGFGIVFVDDKMKIKNVSRATELTKTLLDLHLNQAPFILLHHRTPTSSSNKIRQTHPFVINHGSLKHKYLVVVNGHVYNEKEMKKKHEDELGFVYTTDDKDRNEFNDCEALGWELARLIEGQIKTLETRGSFAFIALQVDKEKVTKVYFGSNGISSCPLKLAMNEREVFISSEGKGEIIKEDILYHFDTTNFKIKKQDLHVKEYVSVPAYNSCGNRSYDEDEYEEYNRDVVKWKQDIKKNNPNVIVEGFTSNEDLVKSCLDNAKEAVENFFTMMEVSTTSDDVIDALNTSLTDAASEMMEGYYTMMGASKDAVIDSILTEKQQEIDVSGISFVEEESDVKLLAPNYSKKN